MHSRKCKNYWAETDNLPLEVVLEWCKSDPDNFMAKKHAFISACQKNRIKYSYDGNPTKVEPGYDRWVYENNGFADWIEYLVEIGILLVERLSFQEWADSLEETRSSEMLSCCDEKHQFFAKELKIAVEAWDNLYQKNRPDRAPIGGHKKYIRDWLKKAHPDLGYNSLERISKIINPNPKGGASPSENF